MGRFEQPSLASARVWCQSVTPGRLVTTFGAWKSSVSTWSNGTVSTVGPVHGNDETPFTPRCEPGSRAVGLGPAKVGQLLDSTRVKCST